MIIDCNNIRETKNQEVLNRLKYYVKGTEKYYKASIILMYNPLDDTYWVVKDREGLNINSNKSIHRNFCREGNYFFAM